MATVHEQLAAGLDEVDIALIAALAAGASTTEAATAASVSATTAYRRMQSAAFRAALAEAKAGRWKPDAERLREEVSLSIARLVELRDSSTTHASTKLRAAVAIVELAIRLHELVNLLPRLAAIEAQLAVVEGDELPRAA